MSFWVLDPNYLAKHFSSLSLTRYPLSLSTQAHKSSCGNLNLPDTPLILGLAPALSLFFFSPLLDVYRSHSYTSFKVLLRIDLLGEALQSYFI